MDLKKLFNYFKVQKTSNLKVVALCVLTATTFWILNALNKDGYYTVVDYPIEFYFDRQDYMAVEELPSKVKIEIQGNGWDLIRKYFNFNVSPFVIEIQKPAMRQVIMTRNIRRELSDKLMPTQLTTILTDSLVVNIDNIVTRKVKVQVDTTSATLAKNIRYASPINIDPAFVTVRGPASIVQRLGGTFTVTLDDDRINRNYSKLLPIKVPEGLQQYLRLEEDNVLVEFNVVELLEGNKRLRLRKVNFPDRVSIEEGLSSVIMTYLVDERYVNDLRDADLEAILNYNNRNRQDSTVNVQLNVRPDYLENISFEPSTVQLIYNDPQ